MEFEIHNLPDRFGFTEGVLGNMVNFVADEIGLQAESCTVVLISDEDLRIMHQEYLGDPEFTDVMTFNLGDDAIEGEIYISLDRIRDNADYYRVSPANELLRTMIHGLLHLAGEDDQTEAERANMRSLENKYLGMLKEKFNFTD